MGDGVDVFVVTTAASGDRAKTDEATAAVTPLTNLFDLIGKALAVGAILLPVVGLVVRFTRFYGLPNDVITAEDPTSLILDGWRADAELVVPLIVLAIAVFALRTRVRRGPDDGAQLLRSFDAFLIAGAGLLALVIELLMLSRPVVGAVAYAMSVGSSAALIIIGLRRAGRLNWIEAGLLAVLIVGFAAISVGTHPWKPQAMEVVFTTDSNLKPGWYGQLGHTSDNAYLVLCGSPERILTVAQSTIVSARYSAVDPSLPSGPGAMGYQPGCDHE